MADEIKYCSWPCPHGCKGSNGKPWQNKGFRVRCQKCEKGPKPGQRKRIDPQDTEPKGKGKGKGAQPRNDPQGQIGKLASTVDQLQKTINELKQATARGFEKSDAQRGNASGYPAEQEEDQLEKALARLKRDQEALKEAESCEDSEAITFYEGRVDNKKAEIQKLRDEQSTPAEQTFNLSNEAMRELRTTRSKVTRIGKQLKEAREEAENLKSQKAELEKAMEANEKKAEELQAEFDANNAKLEQISKATKGEPVAPAPLDMVAVLSNADHLQQCAKELLPSEGANMLKAIMEQLHEFTSAQPDFLPKYMSKVSAEKDVDMGEDTFEASELEAAKAAADEAVGKAGQDADREAVRCQAYHLKLNGIKRARKTVLKSSVKGASRG